MHKKLSYINQAGAAGLCAAKNSIEFGCEVIVFEQQNEIGGTWIYTNETGKDEFGLDIHTSMYDGLHTNLPKEVMGYPDFAIPNNQQNSYISSQEFLNFLNLYADKFQLRDYIKFQNHVLRVRPLLDDTWEVIVRNLPRDIYETFNFDAVLICNGHYSSPKIPRYEGREEFQGIQIHSHDFRKSKNFKNENVLVIGAGPSGMDIANEISKFVKQVTISHHLNEPLKTKFRDNLDQKPDVRRLTRNGVEFVDGSKREYSVILYCTGYKYTFPFLSVDCGVFCEENFVHPLYKHCLSINRTMLAFIGLPFYVCAAQMFDLQSKFCLTFMTGRKILPSKSEMIRDYESEMNERKMKGFKKHQNHMMGEEQGNYYLSLSEVANLKPLKPVMTSLHNFSSMRFVDDLLNFRKDNFRIVDDETFEII